MAISKGVEAEEVKDEKIEKKSVRDNMMDSLGLETETDNDYEPYTPTRSTDGLSEVKFQDLPVNAKIEGEPEFVIYRNNGGKDCNGNPIEAKKWDTLRFRLFDEDEYVSKYINLPKIDDDGFIKNIHERNGFYKDCFNLIFGYFRIVDEAYIIDQDSETGYINKITKINIENLVDLLNDSFRIEIKVVEGEKGYNSILLTDIEE